MQVRIDPRLITLMRDPKYANLKELLLDLAGGIEPEDGTETENRPNRFFVHVDELMIVYVIDDSMMEKIITVALIQ